MSLARDIVISSQPSSPVQGYTGAPVTFNVQANSNKAQYFNVVPNGTTDYTFSGDASGNDPTLNALVGDTLTFYVNAPGQPFFVKTVQGTGSSNAVPSFEVVGATQIVISGGAYDGAYNRVPTDYNWDTSTNTLVTGNNRDAYYNAATQVAIVYDNQTNWYILTAVELINGTDLVPNSFLQTQWGPELSGAIDYPDNTVDPTYGSVAFYSSQGNGVQTGSFTWTPTTAGTYYYNSSNEAFMTGVINVFDPPTLVYDWQVQQATGSTWASIPNGTGSGLGTPTYTTPDLSEGADDGDKYRVVISTPLGTNSPLTSSVYTLNVTTPVITINTQPQDLTTGRGLYANFSVDATVNSPFQIVYQWQLRKNQSPTWTDISPGGTANTLAIPNLDNGDYLRCVLNSTGASEVISSQAQLTVQPFDVPLTVAAGTVNVFSFQWNTGYTSWISNSAPAVGDPPNNYPFVPSTVISMAVTSFPVIQATAITGFTLQGAYKSPYAITWQDSYTKGYYPCPTGTGGGSTRPTEGLIVPRYGL